MAKAKVRVAAWDTFKYSEVFRILEFRDGCVFKTKTTGQYVLNATERLDRTKYMLASVSTSVMGKTEVELDLFEG